MFAVVALAACDPGMENAEEQSDELQLEMEEAAEAFEDPWEGLTLEERAALELEDGTDKEDATGAAVPDDLAARTDAMAALPDCVAKRWYWGTGLWRYASVTNLCAPRLSNGAPRPPVWVKFIWANAIDGPCTPVYPGGYYSEKRGFQAYVTAFGPC